jgi:uncharacterized membrane protein YhiD involved in acid resistance
MLDFLTSQNSSENPTFMGILLVVLSSFFLSFLIVFTYQITSRDLKKSPNFIQSLALISIVSATVMQAIGDSLARGLGMLGALAIIRFRTRLDNPRNMTFMFASIAAGIACGVLGFTIAFVGTIGFCIAALLVHFSRRSFEADVSGNIRITIPSTSFKAETVENILLKHCSSFKLDQYQLSAVKSSDPSEEDNVEVPLVEATYLFFLPASAKKENMLSDLQDLKNIKNIRLRLDNEINE